MVYSSLALSVWSLLFPPFFFLYWLYCDDHGWMSCITECRPSMDAFFWDQLCLFERKSFKNLPFLMIWSTVWSMRWSEIKDMICYFSSCIFPVFDRIKVPVFISTEFPVCLSLFICSGWHRIIWYKIAIKQVHMLMKRNICSNENAPLSSCTWTQIFVSLLKLPIIRYSSGVICPPFLLFFFVSLLYKTRCNLSTIFPNIFKLSEFSDFIIQLREFDARLPDPSSRFKNKEAATPEITFLSAAAS